MDIGTEQVHGEAVCVAGKSTAEVASESARHATRVPHCRRDLGLSSLKISIFGGQRKGEFENDNGASRGGDG